MISETTRSRNPAGHAGLLQNLLALTSALADFFESRFALLAEESKAAFVQVLVLASYLVLALILCAFGYVFLIASAVVALAHLAGISWLWTCLL
jgi:small-conductance mechanosensitive channel